MTIPTRVRVVAALTLVVYLVGLAYALLNPSVDPAIASVGALRTRLEVWHLPSLLVDQTEFLSNVAIFLPVPVLGAAAGGPIRVATWASMALAASCAVELVQWLALSQRSASLVDVAANTLGGLVGALAVRTVARRRPRRGVPSPPRAARMGE